VKGIRYNATAPRAVETNIGKTIKEPNEPGSYRATAGLSLNPHEPVNRKK